MEAESGRRKPAVAEAEHVLSFSGDRRFACLGHDRDRHCQVFDFKGKEVWARDIQADYGEFGLGWGYGSSPLLYNGTLYVQVLHGMKTDDPSYLLGMDSATGSTKWRVERPTDAVAESPDSYTTPAVLTYHGKTEIVVTGGDYVTGHDPATGQELWRGGGLNPAKAGNYPDRGFPAGFDGHHLCSHSQDSLPGLSTGWWRTQAALADG